MIFEQLIISIRNIFILTLLTGVLYPAVLTGVAQNIFPKQANGSLIVRDGKPVGSELIGQYFDKPDYFWGRLSATSPLPYNASGSSGSNLGPLNSSLLKTIQDRVEFLRKSNPENTDPIPVDLVTASASGLDPHISLAAAEFQLKRVAKARGLSELTVEALIQKNSESRYLGILGEPRVSVLKLNLALDQSRL